MAASVAHQAGAAQAELVTESMTAPNISNDSKFRTRVSTNLNLVQSTIQDAESMHLVVHPNKEVVTIPEFTHIWLIGDAGGEIHAALSLYSVRVSCFLPKLSSTTQRIIEMIEVLNLQKPALV